MVLEEEIEQDMSTADDVCGAPEQILPYLDENFDPEQYATPIDQTEPNRAVTQHIAMHDNAANVEKRGQHVKNKPEMSKKARDDQEEWGKTREEVKEDWTAQKIFKKDDEFPKQLLLCQGHAKALRQTLLMSLQIAAALSEIEPLKFSYKEGTNTFGWTGFTVLNADEFNRRIRRLFGDEQTQNGFNDNNPQLFDPKKKATIQNAFRRHRLGPSGASWKKAWLGKDVFVFKPVLPGKRSCGLRALRA
mmetsp:Transcript_59546/g.121991  ORF Transcript_59546/g.121991 Transcript_59546/m.121991 type:complete len:247 (+) Transcript_59546:54-794(+)